ncbi:CHAT domain-containing protein [Microbacterium hibisci]|uniref:CHAT domain-containing protein n=1 Tax=Microbacterium hibisci TaxID=2036000 RepID=UPI001EF1C736|nr:CHAT domain-containing protein [Microbacterium hibisci]
MDVDPDLRARISGTLAFVLARTGALAEAERMCESALSTPGLSPSTVALLAGQMGSIMEQAGRLADADRMLGRAIATVSDPVQQANLLVNRSLVAIQLRRLDAAASDAEAAARAYTAQGMAVDAAEARHNLGYIDLLRGDIVGALQSMQSARPILAGVPFAAMIDVDRAEVYRDAGLTRRAEAILSEVAAALGRRRMTRAQGEAEYSLARSLLPHDPGRAALVAARAARRFRRLGNDTWALRADALRLRAQLSDHTAGRIRATARSRRIPSTDDIAAASVALERGGFRNEAIALRMSQELWRAKQKRAEASSPIRIPRAASMEVRLLAHEVRAERAAAAGRNAEARKHAAAGLDELARWQRTFGSLDLQTSVVMHGRGLALAGLRAAVRSGRPHIVFDWSERTRHLSQQVVPLRPPRDAAAAAELAQLRQLRSEDSSGDWLRNPQAAELEHRALERHWAGTGSGAFHRPASLREVLDVLDADTAVLAYVYTADSMRALITTREGARIVDIPAWESATAAMRGLRADLDMASSVRSGPMSEVVRRSLERRLAALSAALLEQPLAAVGDRRIVITTPGVLAGIPWAMLPAMRGRVFTLATSVTRWLRSHDDPQSAHTAGFVVGPGVARGPEEVQRAMAAWGRAPVIAGATATVDAVEQLAARVDVLHVAAHGRHAGENPMFSGLELADGTLFGYDIDLIEKVPETVVLSACEVGRSSVRWGEEAVGMTRVWLHAGARSVVAAPVVVADDDACELLGALHDGLAAGIPPSVALVQASERTGIVAPFQVHGAGF